MDLDYTKDGIPLFPLPPEKYQCKKCYRHVYPIKTLRTDPKTYKKWLITECPQCGYESDLEPFIYKNESSSKKKMD